MAKGAKSAPGKAAVKGNEKKNKTKDLDKKQKLVLTPSEKELGIKITQPNQKIIDTMTRLYAVPSEKLRVWTCWLTKVGEKADDWQWWLRAHIKFTLKISMHLQKATIALEAEKNPDLGQGDASIDDAEEFLPVKEKFNADTSENIDQEAKEVSAEEETISKEKEDLLKTTDTVASEDGPENEQPSVEVAEAKKSQEKGDKKAGNKKKKTKGSKEDKLEPKIMYKEGFWPVGVRWKPFSQRTKRKPPPERQPDEISIPRNEEEMMELIRKIRHQGVIYRSLYKHWSETAEQAVKGIVGRTVLPTKQVYLNDAEDLPYFFYLDTEPDIDYVIEHDDEEILLPDPGREKITRDFKHLYFNLIDKPGKGGKPWL